MVIGFAILGIAGGLNAGWIALGIIAILIVGGMVAAMAFAAMKPDLLLKLLAPLVRVIDRFLTKRKKKPVDAWVKDTVNTYAQSAALMTKNKQDIGADLGLNVAASIFELGCFAFVALAFGVHDIEAMICGYVVVTLFAMISFVPQGVGIVEAAALVAFALFGIDQATAMAVIMVYRAIVFWLPFLIGAVVIQRSKLLSEHEKSTKSAHRPQRALQALFSANFREQLDYSSYSIKFVDSTVRTYHCMNFSRGFLRAYPKSAAGTKKSASSPIAIQKSFW